MKKTRFGDMKVLAKETIEKTNAESAAARLEVEEARREIERLSRENRQLRLGNKF